MDRFSFVEILAQSFLPFARREYGHDFIYHQDNDPKHTSFIASQFFKDNDMIWSKAPPRSPDLNPIENLWADMKKFVASKLCKTMRELKIAVSEFWLTITPEKCSNYIDHLQEVMLAVIARDGGWANM